MTAGPRRTLKTRDTIMRIAVAALLTSLLCTRAQGAEFFVSPAGNDRNTGRAFPDDGADPRTSSSLCGTTSEWMKSRMVGKYAQCEFGENFITHSDPGFVDAGSMNFALKDDSAVYREIPGFRKIPFDEIGPRKKQ